MKWDAFKNGVGGQKARISKLLRGGKAAFNKATKEKGPDFRQGP